MTQLSEQYRARVATCDEDAERATLANVRDRSRCSAETWRAMAGQIKAAEALKAEAAKGVPEG